MGSHCYGTPQPDRGLPGAWVDLLGPVRPPAVSLVEAARSAVLLECPEDGLRIGEPGQAVQRRLHPCGGRAPATVARVDIHPDQLGRLRAEVGLARGRS